MFIPSAGEPMTVALPNEMIRATVIRVINRNTIEARLDLAAPFTRIHGYNFGDVIRFRREKNILGEKWAAVDKPVPVVPVRAAAKVSYIQPDERAPDPERPKPQQKVKRRSDAETKPRV